MASSYQTLAVDPDVKDEIKDTTLAVVDALEEGVASLNVTDERKEEVTGADAACAIDPPPTMEAIVPKQSLREMIDEFITLKEADGLNATDLQAFGGNIMNQILMEVEQLMQEMDEKAKEIMNDPVKLAEHGQWNSESDVIEYREMLKSVMSDLRPIMSDPEACLEFCSQLQESEDADECCIQ